MTKTGECLLSIDAMGGDAAPGMVIDGLAIAVLRHPDVRYHLHGDAAKLAPLLDAEPAVKARAEVKHTATLVEMHAKPSKALHDEKRAAHQGGHSSMWQSVAAVRTGEAQAAVSAGNTGALMVFAKAQLKTMAGIERPAIAGLWPTVRGETVVLDLGANIGLDERQLVDFAILGEAYARVLFGLERPSVALLNIGAEEVKGNEAIKAAAADIRSSGIDMNFLGFVEGNDISMGVADVVVTDGFTGNVAIKTAEGIARLIANYLSSAMRRSLMSRIGYLFAMGAFQALREKMDPRSVNGGVFLGLNGTVVKSHGGTDGKGFAAAIDLAVDLARSDISAKVKSRLAQIKGHRPPTALERMEAQTAESVAS